MAAEDWLVGFLRDFASLSEEERDAAIDTLPPADRDAILALAEAREVTSETGLLQVLNAGQVGLEKLYELEEPGDLYTLINLAVRQNPNIVVEALFAAVVLHRGWDQEEPSGILALREQWHWHVHEQFAAREHEDDSKGRGLA
jgi:tetrahydromethanopterin S-methyltransferase subunit H